MPKHSETHVDMRVHKTRDYYSPSQVGYFCIDSLVYKSIGHFSGKQNLPSLYGDCLHNWIRLVHSINFGVCNNVIGEIIKMHKENIFGHHHYAVFSELRQFFSQVHSLNFRQIVDGSSLSYSWATDAHKDCRNKYLLRQPVCGYIKSKIKQNNKNRQIIVIIL